MGQDKSFHILCVLPSTFIAVERLMQSASRSRLYVPRVQTMSVYRQQFSELCITGTCFFAPLLSKRECKKAYASMVRKRLETVIISVVITVIRLLSGLCNTSHRLCKSPSQRCCDSVTIVNLSGFASVRGRNLSVPIDLTVVLLNDLAISIRRRRWSRRIPSVTEKTIFGVHVSPGSADTLLRGGGTTNRHSIAYISAKNHQNRLMCVEITVCNISVVF